MSIVFIIKGLPGALRAIDDIAGLKWLRGALTAAISDVKAEVAQYPPATQANVPRAWASKGQNRWYERGYGPKWARRDGTVGGRRTSQTLGRRWTTQVGDSWAKAGNNASYVRYVQDEEYQAAWAARYGWTTGQAALDRAANGVLEKIGDEVERRWGER